MCAAATIERVSCLATLIWRRGCGVIIRCERSGTIVNEALAVLEREFAALYSPIGRPSIPPEKLLRAMLLQAFYSIRSERLLMERLEYDLLFRWFVGILEGSNRSRVADLTASPARDLFEAGLNEAASCERGAMGARSGRW